MRMEKWRILCFPRGPPTLPRVPRIPPKFPPITWKRTFSSAIHWSPTKEHIEEFERNGFLIIPRLIDQSTVNSLLQRFDSLFKGDFETGIYPDEWHWRHNMSLPNVTREICNAWKCDLTIASIVLDEGLGKCVSQLGKWDGARLAQDDIWMKPPEKGKEISFHTDCAYIPWPEITCWIALDNVSQNSGTLEYIRGSHKWSKFKDHLDTNKFHAPNYSYHQHALEAAKEEGISEQQVKENTVKVEVEAGGAAFHNGNLWHGSGVNTSKSWRRTIGIHLIPADSSFAGKGNVGYIYQRYKLFNSDEMNETFFPIIYTRNNYRSPFIKYFFENYHK